MTTHARGIRLRFGCEGRAVLPRDVPVNDNLGTHHGWAGRFSSTCFRPGVTWALTSTSTGAATTRPVGSSTALAILPSTRTVCRPAALIVRGNRHAQHRLEHLRGSLSAIPGAILRLHCAKGRSAPAGSKTGRGLLYRKPGPGRRGLAGCDGMLIDAARNQVHM